MRSAIVVFLAMAVGSVRGDDSIRVTFETGDCVLCSTEKSEIYISRTTTGGSTVVNVDKFFASVRASLAQADMPLSWSLVPAIHSDTVRVDILLGEMHYSLTAGYGRKGIPEDLGESPANHRRRQALEDILRNTAEYSAVRYRVRGSK